MVELSTAMVRLYRELGRAPTKVSSNYAGPDILISTLEKSMTPAEGNMAGLGEHRRLRDMRMFFQFANAGQFTKRVEHITGRRVRAFVSGIDVDQDVSSEVFYLEPRSELRGTPNRLDGRRL
jgi:uncharacterized protein YbcI